MLLTGAQILWECLEREGVEVVFGYPGGNILPAYDALAGSRIRHVLCRHEQGGAHMADGYARASGRVGVVMATSGPGATNLVTGLATAMMDSVPMVAITGQVPSHLLGSDAFQETDVTGVTLPITKHNYLVQDPAALAGVLREAFALARGGRPGPVLVDITKDAQLKQAEFDWIKAAPVRHLRQHRPPVAEACLRKARALIKASRRPVILAGHGVTLSGAHHALAALAEKAGIPVAATLLGLDALPGSHPLFLGFMGLHGAPWTNRAIQEADLILACGMRFDDRVTGEPATFAPLAKKIHVEIDPTEVNKIIQVDLPLIGDLREVLAGLGAGLVAPDTRAWLARLEALKREHRAEAWPEPHPGAALGPLEVLRELDRQAPGALMVTDVGQHQMWEAQVVRHQYPHHHLTSGGLGTMGFALPAAIGAKLARPEAEVWVVAGDGAMQMNSQELMTLRQEGLKVNVAVLNNGSLGMVRQLQTHYYDDRRCAVDLANPDFVMLARAYGLEGLRATTAQEARDAIQAARTLDGPVLLEFVINQEANVYPMVPAGGRLEDMLFEPPAPRL